MLRISSSQKHTKLTKTQILQQIFSSNPRRGQVTVSQNQQTRIHSPLSMEKEIKKNTDFEHLHAREHPWTDPNKLTTAAPLPDLPTKIHTTHYTKHNDGKPRKFKTSEHEDEQQLASDLQLPRRLAHAGG